MPTTKSSQSTSNADNRLNDLRILIVDDADSCYLLRVTLQLSAAESQAVLSAHEAFNLFVHWQPDLLSVSTALPQEDGCSLIRRVRAFEVNRGDTVPAIAVMTDNREEARLHVLSTGFCRALLKPLDLDELVSTIVAVVNENRLSNWN